MLASAALRRPRVLIIGCGDIGTRLIGRFGARIRAVGTTRDASRFARLRAAGVRLIPIDLDAPRQQITRLRGIATHIIYLAPPPANGTDDPRMRRALALLLQRPAMVARTTRRPATGRRRHGTAPKLVYVSTTGVYGDRGGARIDETARPAPASDRAVRRLGAERRLRRAIRCGSVRALILRAPGIYATDRLPLESLRAGRAVLRRADDVFTNHIHADDLARAAWIALWRGANARLFNAVDRTEMLMGDWYDALADCFALARPRRVARDQIGAHVSAAALTFLSESRRISGARIGRELRLRWLFPDVGAWLARTRAGPNTPPVD